MQEFKLLYSESRKRERQEEETSNRIFEHMVHNVSQISNCYYCKLFYCIYYINAWNT